jgi:tagatose 6-phosphate kinase
MILVVGLSPAWQRTLEYERFTVGDVNRAKRVSETASGKGVNVARVAKQLGANVRLLTVAGGHRGQLLEKSLREQGIAARIIRVAAETRICQTLVSDGFATTELVEEAGALMKDEVEKVLGCFARGIRVARLVVLSGTVPTGCGDDFYARLIREANQRGVPVLVDTQRQQLLNAVRQKPFLAKINRDELGAATRMRCDGIRGLRAAARRFVGYGAQWVVVTHSSDAVHVFNTPNANLWEFKPPRVDARNPIGSGDAMLAGIACGLGQGKTMLEAVWLGVVCGTANAMTAMPGHVRLADVKTLLKGI